MGRISSGEIVRRNLERLMRERAITQARAARIIRITQSVFGRKLKGYVGFSFGQLDDLARYFHVPVPWFFIDHNDPVVPYERRVTDDRRQQERRKGERRNA